MATFIGKIGSQYQLVLTVNTNSQSVSNNTSTLSYNLRVDKLSGYGYWANSQSYSVRINGQTVRSGTWDYDFNNYSSKTITSGTITVNHNSNGSVTVPVSASVSMYSIGTGSVSSTYTPSRILRGVDNFTFNTGWGQVTGSKTITFSKPNSNIRASLEWRYYNNKYDGWSNTRIVSSNYTSGSNFSFSSEDVNLMHTQNPESKEVTIQVVLKSYNGTTLTRSVSRNVSLKLKVEVPIINSTFEVRGQNQNLLGASNLAVQNIHWLKILDNVTANNGATISRISVEFEGRTQTANNAEFNIRKAGNSDIYVTAVDSRGFSYRKKIGTVKSTKYLPPSLNGYKAIRLENGVQNPLGTIGAVVGNIKITAVNNSSGRNINSAWWKVDFQGTTYQNSTINATKSLPIEQSQNFTLEFGDKFKSLKISGYIPVGEAPFVLATKSIGINTIPNDELGGIYIGGSKNFDRKIEFTDSKDNWIFRTGSGFGSGNGKAFIMQLGGEYDIGFMSDGTIWKLDPRNHNRISRIGG